MGRYWVGIGSVLGRFPVRLQSIWQGESRNNGKIKLNLPVAELSGKMGDYYFRKGKKEGEVILVKRPKKPKKPSTAQQDQWGRFTEASDYATTALANPELCAYYEAEALKRDLQPRNVAMSDYLTGKNLLSK